MATKHYIQNLNKDGNFILQQHKAMWDENGNPLFRMKPASQETKQKRRMDAKYESRNNRCEKCFTQISLTGVCMCD